VVTESRWEVRVDVNCDAGATSDSSPGAQPGVMGPRRARDLSLRLPLALAVSAWGRGRGARALCGPATDNHRDRDKTTEPTALRPGCLNARPPGPGAPPAPPPAAPGPAT
jgi:hypothetical protein